MPSGTLLFLLLVIILLLWTNSRDNPDHVEITGKPANYSRTPYFLRYNAPVRDRTQYHPVPVQGSPLATNIAPAASASGFSGFQPRVV